VGKPRDEGFSSIVTLTVVIYSGYCVVVFFCANAKRSQNKFSGGERGEIKKTGDHAPARTDWVERCLMLCRGCHKGAVAAEAG
jgi:hypothetical protein